MDKSDARMVETVVSFIPPNFRPFTYLIIAMRDGILIAMKFLLVDIYSSGKRTRKSLFRHTLRTSIRSAHSSHPSHRIGCW